MRVFLQRSQGTSSAFGAAIRGAIDSWSESFTCRDCMCCEKTRAFPAALFPLLPTLTSHWYFRCQENFICLVLCLRPGHGPGCDGWLATLVVASAGASGAFAQTAGCQVTYTAPTWAGGNGFGASIDIRNTGPAINGWNLVFNLPERSAHLRMAGRSRSPSPREARPSPFPSDAPWNATRSPPTRRSTLAFNGTFSGANNPPTSFTLNGTACNGGGTTEHGHRRFP